ncbi:MAG: hypothetical protein N2B04_07685 [Psychrobacter sp.]
MISNSFNRYDCTNKNSCSTFSGEKIENEDSGKDHSRIDDWAAKYDISISILREEYSQGTLRLRNVDEKANKYLLVISIIFTGLFVVLSSSAIESLVFSYKVSLMYFILTLVFVTTFSIGSLFGFLTFRAILKCFDLVELQKMPSILNTLESTKVNNSVEYKHYLISCFQLVIDATDKTVSSKQKHIISISKNIKFFIVLITFSLAILISLKILG